MTLDIKVVYNLIVWSFYVLSFFSFVLIYRRNLRILLKLKSMRKKNIGSSCKWSKCFNMTGFSEVFGFIVPKDISPGALFSRNAWLQ